MSASEDLDSEDEDLSLESLTRDLSRHTQRPLSVHSMGAAVCCCGSDQCDSLRRSQSILQELEAQMKIAGSLGQALLKRHESSMAEAESRQAATAIIISELEMKTTELEYENSRKADENKLLLHNLEELNASMAMSELRVRELQEDLDAAHAELSRISAHAARTALLEAQLAVLESEQEELRNTIATTKEEERAAVARWRRAERQLAELEKQLERIQREHALERARSQNILERMEQRRLASQRAGTFPAALAADKSALSRFMKEILAENGHLQLGVAELRDMLAQSQEEVKMLREKLESMDGEHLDIGRSPLSMELSRSPSQPGIAAAATGNAAGVVVHHHHYHTGPGSKAKAIKPPVRRPKKKRGITADQHIDTARARGFEAETSAAAHKRWSTSTGTAPLSSSPTSTFRDSIFDRIDDETSRPTSADSNYPAPWPKQSWAKHNRKSSMNPPPFTILHTTEEVSSEADSVVQSERAPSPPPQASPPRPIPVLKRSVSHESLLSVSAMENYHASPSLSVSSFTSRRAPNLRQNSVKSNDPQASITPGVAIRAQRSGQYCGSAYSRLLGLAEGNNSPPKKTISRKASPGSSTGGGGGGWFWKYVTLAPGGSKPGRSEEPRLRPPTSKPIPTFVDEDLLKESLVDGPEQQRREEAKRKQKRKRDDADDIIDPSEIPRPAPPSREEARKNRLQAAALWASKHDWDEFGNPVDARLLNLENMLPKSRATLRRERRFCGLRLSASTAGHLK
ncbi:hypothetical protein FN846DRAFT_919704 [Sphaerosporella brunnea]|uniref:Uncharacterized protein n=1 Tax=Sphaerosporella brunnea TaxID=1250544 RepID=A0A5J5EUK1_9PEZI|nr:hypothetical protein FN846DRAFT_919704 [Sphaerosporella brunnea]